MERTLTRREALLAGAAAGAAALLPTSVARARPVANVAALKSRLGSRLVAPGDSGWDAARALWNPRLNATPRAVAFCRSEEDVAAVLGAAAGERLPVAARGGRHSFAGYSNADGGLVCDLSQMNAISLRGSRAVVGAGADVLDAYKALAIGRGVSLPVGTCPTVGVAGLMLGGGFGHLARRFGVTSDSLRAARVVLADGRAVHVDASHRADLFWALRGGGAGYGVVTQLEFDVHPAADPVAFVCSFDWDHAPAALDAWQRAMPHADARLAYGRFRALRSPDGSLSCTASGHWYGTDADLDALLAPLVAAGPRSVTRKETAFLDAVLPDGTSRDASGGATAQVDHFPNYQRSDFVGAPLSGDAIATLLAKVAVWPGGGPTAHEGGVQLDAMGGKINAVGPTATAFAHRRELFHVAYLSFWGPQDSADVAAADAQWVRDTSQAMRPHVSGAAYQNYIDSELNDWARAYYGPNLAKLRAVKRRYDPENVLGFAQGISG